MVERGITRHGRSPRLDSAGRASSSISDDTCRVLSAPSLCTNPMMPPIPLLLNLMHIHRTPSSPPALRRASLRAVRVRALLKLIPTGRFGTTVCIWLQVADLLLARPAHSLQPLSQDRVRVVVGRVHPISVHGGEVLDLEFDEGGGEFGCVA